MQIYKVTHYYNEAGDTVMEFSPLSAPAGTPAGQSGTKYIGERILVAVDEHGRPAGRPGPLRFPIPDATSAADAFEKMEEASKAELKRLMEVRREKHRKIVLAGEAPPLPPPNAGNLRVVK